MPGKLSKYRTMLKLRPLLRYRKMVEEEIRRLIPEETKDLRVYMPIHHMLEAGGKYVRPILLLLSCEAVGGDPKAIAGGAAGIELGHVASLIHDDIIDGAHLRRNVMSVQEKFGVHDAVLSGDLLVFNAFLSLALLSERSIPAERIVRALRVISEAGINLCVGQELEANYSALLDTTKEEYIDVIAKKTGAFTKAITESGAILGGGTDEQVQAMSDYGLNLGIAFQIKDDLLSATKTDEEIMKSSGTDIVQRTMTLPVILAYERCREEDRAIIEKVFSSSRNTDSDIELFNSVLRKTGAIEESEKVAWEYVKKAKEPLKILPKSTSKKMLLELADFAVERPF